MDRWVLRMPWGPGVDSVPEQLLTREWLVTNGLGGYASGTVAGAATRRYHGLLIAALPAPLGRQVMLNHLMELIRLPDGTTALLGGEESTGGGLKLHGHNYLREFRLETGIPVWRYEVKGVVFEKRLVLPYGQNTVHVQYRLISGEGPVRIKLRPSIHFRPHEAPVVFGRSGPYLITAEEDRYEIRARESDMPPLRIYLYGEQRAFTLGYEDLNVYYRVEESRGYESVGTLWSPGYFRATLTPGTDVTLVASTENWETVKALRPEEALASEEERLGRLLMKAAPAAKNSTTARALVIAADQFIITPAGRIEDAARRRAAGEEIRSIIAGYHWFTDWGRDTMISLEGLTLTTGRREEARSILRTFGQYVKDGLLPNLFPEGEKEGLYHTADATLWFFHAIDRYLDVSGDRDTLSHLLPTLREIVHKHLEGTRFGIGVDPSDFLLRQGEQGYQLTWMDAKVGDWVVTPRRGKAVEINALWYNALKLLSGWLEETGDSEGASEMARAASRVYESFNRRFWFEEGKYLYDVIDGEETEADTALRPNQVIAISLRHPVLDPTKWESVLHCCRENLLTPVGLRSLAPGQPDYKPTYDGDLRSRDAAYHQGTVWAWLIGPFIDAWLRAFPERAEDAREFLSGFSAHLSEACIGSVCEIFDAERPNTPRGCIAQAWSVAEVLRCVAKTAPPSDSEDSPPQAG